MIINIQIMNKYNSVDCMYIMNTLIITKLFIINVFIMYIQSTLLYLFIIRILMIISYRIVENFRGRKFLRKNFPYVTLPSIYKHRAIY